MSQEIITSRQREKAALLVAEDKLSDEEIAGAVDCNRRTLTRWKNHATFRARVAEITAEFAAKIVAEGITNRQNRLDALNDRHQKMRQVIAERGADQEIADVPGGKTGLVVQQMKMLGHGASAEMVREYSVDTALLKEMRATEQQAAQEVGQWADKHEYSGKDGVPLNVTIAFDRADQDTE